MLYCKTCQHQVPRTEAQCGFCRNGFVNQLACLQCGQDVPRGASHCARCEGPAAVIDAQIVDAGAAGLPGLPPPGGLPQLGYGQLPPGFGQMPPGTMMIVVGGQGGAPPAAPPPGTSLEHPHNPHGGMGLARMHLPPPVPEVYRSHRYGAMAEVTMNGADAAILTRMQQAAVLLEALALDMNNLQGHMPSTRDCIKACRMLGLELQEEVEVRLGPNGARMPIGNGVTGKGGRGW